MYFIIFQDGPHVVESASIGVKLKLSSPQRHIKCILSSTIGPSRQKVGTSSKEVEILVKPGSLGQPCVLKKLDYLQDNTDQYAQTPVANINFDTQNPFREEWRDIYFTPLGSIDTYLYLDT